MIDLGCASWNPSRRRTLNWWTGTPGFRSPAKETKQRHNGFEGDIWAMGMVLCLGVVICMILLNKNQQYWGVQSLILPVRTFSRLNEKNTHDHHCPSPYAIVVGDLPPVFPDAENKNFCYKNMGLQYEKLYNYDRHLISLLKDIFVARDWERIDLFGVMHSSQGSDFSYTRVDKPFLGFLYSVSCGSILGQ